MDDKNRTLGYLFSGAFIVGLCIDLVLGLAHGHTWMELLLDADLAVALGAALLFSMGAFVPKLRYFQPYILVVASTFLIFLKPESFYGLGSILLGALLLERAGFFDCNKALKVSGLLAYAVIAELAGFFVHRDFSMHSIMTAYFRCCLGLFIFLLYKDKPAVFSEKLKPVLALSDMRLTSTEKLFVLQLLGGKSQKLLAYDLQVSESTVRNTLSRAYKKLGVDDRVGLALLGERFEIID